MTEQLRGIMPTPESTQRAIGLVELYRMSRLTHVAAIFGLSDLLIDGPRTAEDMAEQLGVHPESLHRVMRASASFDLFTMDDEERFGLNEVSAALRSDVPNSIRPLARLFAAEPFESYVRLPEAITKGESAFGLAHGAEFFEYVASHPELAEKFNAAMTGRSEARSAAIIDAYDFSQHKEIIDVGGGQGGLISAILKANPGLRGVLFDLPHVVDKSASVTERFGVSERLKVVGGDFFQGLPKGMDGYILATVLHDWDDEKAIEILAECRKAIDAKGKVLTIDLVIPPTLQKTNDGLLHPVYSYDVHMMAINGKGKERTRAEFEKIYRESGFQLTEVYPTRVLGLSVVEGAPVS